MKLVERMPRVCKAVVKAKGKVDTGSQEAAGTFNITSTMDQYNIGVESRQEQQKNDCLGKEPKGVPDKGEVMESRCV